MKRKSNGSTQAGAKKPTSPARARREKYKVQAIELYLKGHTQQKVRDIMEEETGHNFGLHTIHRFIQEAQKDWRANKEEMLTAHKEIELEKINRIESEFWGAWERSKANAKSTSETKTKGKPGTESATPGKLATTSKKTEERNSNGDPRFMEGALRCVEMRNKLLGIEVPQIQINNNNTATSTGNKVVRNIVFKTRVTTSEQDVEKEDADD